MFKRRVPQPQQEQKRQIGQPQLLHTTYDQNNLLPTSSGLTASNAPSERFDSSLDTGDVFKPGHHRDVSSVYSRPSHEAQHDFSDYAPAPPASSSESSIPTMSATLSQPYSDLPSIRTPDSSTMPSSTKSSIALGKKPVASHIPQLGKSKPVEKRWAAPSEGTTKWDPYRGEPVRNGRGKEGSVRPASFEKKLRGDERYEVSVTGGTQAEKPKKPTWGERAAKLTKDAFDARPPWKGGGGRSAIVDPVKDTEVPRSSPKFTASRDVSKPGLEESESASSMATTKRSERNMSPVSQLGGRYDDENQVKREDSTQNVSPIATTAKSYLTPQQQAQTPQIRQVSNSVPSPAPSKVTRKPVGPRSMDKENRSPQTSQPATSPQDTPQQQQAGGLWASLTGYGRPPPQELQEDPVSRFSWTTVNTTTTYQQDSPPPSPPRAPVPPLDRQAWRNVGVSAKAEKPPTPPPHEDEKQTSTKSLPPAPGVSKAMSHIEVLLAQENDLAMRRRNVVKIIKELQQIDSASPLDVDWKTVKANKKKLDEHQTQLADLEREQHELGLSIARARRKAERDDGTESGLWVRKITG
ncbi:hypothetical protein KVT40_000350 [Elsinoe batatas]|uniref:Uncharacterized protein n=1 Tax=Elsinoe batatas TaxID=2601811 RepID=A0A8K0LBW9_9PEZI|nr:hypothetical protein KVT40_000350 [Elsinoe batatas]